MTQFINPRTKLFQHLDRLQAIKEGGKPPPVNCELMLSNRCDLKCALCHYSYTHTRGPWAGHADKPEGAISSGDLMDFSLACDVLRQLCDAGVKSITWSGGGEPSLHPQFDSIVACAAHLGLEQGIYTHGGHIRGERAAWMRQHFEWIYFSFDAYDVESYKLHKGVNRFDKVCANIRNIVALPGKATIGMGFLLHSGNYQHIYAMQKLGRDLGVDYVQFRPLISYSQDKPSELVEDTSWIDDCAALLQQYAGDSFVIADVDRFRMYQRWAGFTYSTCRWSALQAVITPNGGVWRCTNKMEHPDALLGDLSLESFADIWQRAGGVCGVDSSCRILCRGEIANRTLDTIMSPAAHVNFV